MSHLQQLISSHGGTFLKWSMLFVLSFLMLLLLSPDSPLMHPFGGRCDSSWFFTAGKAWMEGMTPYVDFADSKGPLLWLIYGIGYLLTPTSYTGVFWLSVIAYTFTFAFVWQTCRLKLRKHESMIVVACMSACFFCRIFHTEVRAEDFCMPAICGGIYLTCSALAGRSGGGKLSMRAFLLGVCMAYCLLIKWNYFFMMGGMAIIVAGLSLNNRSYEGIVFGFLGMVVATLPFIIYFAVEGNLGAFIHEYFVNTFLITDSDYSSGMFVRLAGILFGGMYAIFKTTMLLAALLGIIAFCHGFRVSFWLVLAYVPFYLFLELKATGLHYCSTVVPFLVFLFAFIVGKCSVFINKTSPWVCLVVSLAIYIGGIGFNLQKERLAINPSKEQAEWDAIQKIMAKKKQPRIFFSANDYGQGLLTRALPACKYWARQSGANTEMTREREQAVRTRKPDFIFIMVQPVPELRRLALECGYHQCFASFPTSDGKTEKHALPIYAK